MNHVLVTLRAHLEALTHQVRATIPSDEPLGNAHANWSFPCLTRAELVEEAATLMSSIDAFGRDDLGAFEAPLLDYIRRIQHLQQHTAPQLWSNAGQAVPAYMLTLQGLQKVLKAALGSGEEEAAAAASKANKLASQLRSLEARLNGLQPRAASLSEMVERIENAYNAADQLHTDLETLAEARQKIAALAKEAEQDQQEVSRLRDEASGLNEDLAKSAKGAEAVLENCETAYSAATSKGLAAAFTERSNELSKSMWVWVVGLVAALGAGGYFGSAQLHALSELLKAPNASASVVTLNLLLSVFSVGAPVWFAWLATKQIGQRFRLAEDYAFKASISRAYEGFRREASRFDKDMEAKLLTSALSRLDELPLRLVEPTSHGSPWHELASSEVVKQAVNAVPGFAEQVKGLAAAALPAIIPKAQASPAKQEQTK